MFIVITRFRLSDDRHRDYLFEAAVAVFAQATGSFGNLGTEVLPDANDVFWTRTAWSDRESVVAFMTTEPDRRAMGHISEWCNEATYVEWTQENSMFPEWRLAYDRLVEEGRVTPLPHPSDSHETRSFPPPVES